MRFGPGEPRHIGYTGNVSSSGMMVRTIRVFEPGTRLVVDMDLGRRRLRLQGTVVWARAGDTRHLALGRVGMGLKFINPPGNLMEMVSPGAPAG